MGATAVLIAAIAFADRASTQVTAVSLRLPAGIRTLVTDLANLLGFGEVVTPMHSFPLGIDAPQGVDRRDLPRGLSDYILPSSSTPVTHMQSSQLGIDLPYGAIRAELPSGLTDYLRPAQTVPHTPTPAMSSVLGIPLPYGTNVSDLPAGIRDYLCSDRSR